MALFQYVLSHDVTDTVHVNVACLLGSLPQFKHHRAQPGDEDIVAVDVLVEATLAVEGHTFDGPTRCMVVPAGPHGCEWNGTGNEGSIPFSLRVCDLLPACVLGVSVWALGECEPPKLVGSAVMPLFSKKGRLKTGFQKLNICAGSLPDLRWPSATTGKIALSKRGVLGQLDQKLKQLERRELPPCPWLDRKSLRTVAQQQTETSGDQGLQLVLFLQSFDFAVLYSQPSMRLPQAMRNPGVASARAAHSDSFRDPEVDHTITGHDPNPCEYKAFKLSHALGSMGSDRDAKPNKGDLQTLRQAIKLPPAKALTNHQKTQVSKFRYYLATQSGSVIPFLKSVEWTSSQAASQAIALLKEWRSVSVEEALQMLSSTFRQYPSIRSFGVKILQTKASEDNIYEMLIQLVQCLRFDGANNEYPLSEFLIERCSRSTRLAVALHWSLLVDVDHSEHIHKQLHKALAQHNAAGLSAIKGQTELKALLVHFAKEMATLPNNSRLQQEYLEKNLTEQQCRVFKSARSPVRFVFNTSQQQPHAEARESSGLPRELGPPGPPLQIIFKSGDDLRQDQFVCQLIGIMDGVLKRENLDLRLTPYWVLPMSPTSGIMEFVPSATLQELTAGKAAEGILRYLAENCPARPDLVVADIHPSRLHAAITPHAMENFVRSNAGYAIISYLLDMGDRHLENLLLTRNGKLFHIDFGYVLGMRDPKQWAKVPVCLKSQIIAAMGGQTSDLYMNFRKLAVEAYIILRKHAPLFLTLLSCMAGSKIECFTADSSKTSLEFAVSQMEDRFKMDVDDDTARTHIFALIDQSIANILAPMGDQAHRFATKLRT